MFIMESTNCFSIKNMIILASYVPIDASLLILYNYFLKANETHVTNQLVKTTNQFLLYVTAQLDVGSRCISLSLSLVENFIPFT